MYGRILYNYIRNDTISGGATISAIMEWYEKGIITKEHTDGLEMNFGNGSAMVEMVRKMCLREGCGDLYADGSYAAAKRLVAKPWTMSWR